MEEKNNKKPFVYIEIKIDEHLIIFLFTPCGLIITMGIISNSINFIEIITS
jgi:hypothetical protein